LFAGALLVALPLGAQRISDVRNTPHNLSTSGTGAVHASPGGTDEVCVFCHTPHQARLTDEAGQPLRAPLWNRRVPAGSTYTAYTSSTLDAASISDGFNNQPGGSSKLCLSCHDGTLAIGNVAVLGGATNVSIPMQGTAGGVMPAGEGTASGFTRNLGTDLRNDHPISVTFNAALVTRDGELRPVDGNQRWPADGSVVGGLYPHKDVFPKTGQSSTIADTTGSFNQEVYVILAGWENNGEIASFQIYINPLINWVWVGGIVMIIGFFAAFWPHEEPATKPARASSPAPAGAKA
jgi:hypothetical protein